MTARQALAGLLAVPYWVLMLMSWETLGMAVPFWWAAAGAAVGGVVAALVQPRVLGWLASWMWLRVEALARAWKEEQQ